MDISTFIQSIVQGNCTQQRKQTVRRANTIDPMLQDSIKACRDMPYIPCMQEAARTAVLKGYVPYTQDFNKFVARYSRKIHKATMVRPI